MNPAELFEYNIWANKRITSMVPARLLDVETPSSFDTLRKTIYHIWDAEALWLQRLQGKNLRIWPSQEFKGSYLEASTKLIENSQNFLDLIKHQSEFFFNREIEYRTIKGEKFSQSIRQVCHHVINHSTFHRGQVITMLRTLGHKELKGTDYILYLREKDTELI